VNFAGLHGEGPDTEPDPLAVLPSAATAARMTTTPKGTFYTCLSPIYSTQFSGVSAGISSDPDSGASKNVATKMVSPPVGLKAECTWP
jgi:hypothetical protein